MCPPVDARGADHPMDTMLTGHQDIDHGRWTRIDRSKGLRGADGLRVLRRGAGGQPGETEEGPAAHENVWGLHAGRLVVEFTLSVQHGSIEVLPPGCIGAQAT